MKAVWSGIDENDIENLKKQPEFSRVGGYYIARSGDIRTGIYGVLCVYGRRNDLYARDQVNLVRGRLPEKENEVAVSKYFLSAYGNNSKIGEAVMLIQRVFMGNIL